MTSKAMIIIATPIRLQFIVSSPREKLKDLSVMSIITKIDPIIIARIQHFFVDITLSFSIFIPLLFTSTFCPFDSKDCIFLPALFLFFALGFGVWRIFFYDTTFFNPFCSYTSKVLLNSFALKYFVFVHKQKNWIFVHLCLKLLHKSIEQLFLHVVAPS